MTSLESQGLEALEPVYIALLAIGVAFAVAGDAVYLWRRHVLNRAARYDYLHSLHGLCLRSVMCSTNTPAGAIEDR